MSPDLLNRAEELLRTGERKLSYNSTRDEKTIEAEPSVRLDYIEICDPRTLQEIDQIDQDAVFALAAYVGKVRLIDNFVYRTTVEL